MYCLICGDKCDSFKYEYEDIDCYRCENCELIFKDPAIYQSFDEQKPRYDLHENDSDSAGYRIYFQKFIDFVLPRTDSIDAALDFGCGESSLLADMLIEQGIACDYYDPIYHSDQEYKNSRYDLITSVEVFEHLHDPMTVFKELLSIVNKDGYIAIRTEFHLNSIDRFSTWHYPRDPTHIVFFSPKTFRIMCELQGCKYLADNGKNMILVQER